MVMATGVMATGGTTTGGNATMGTGDCFFYCKKQLAARRACHAARPARTGDGTASPVFFLYLQEPGARKVSRLDKCAPLPKFAVAVRNSLLTGKGAR